MDPRQQKQRKKIVKDVTPSPSADPKIKPARTFDTTDLSKGLENTGNRLREEGRQRFLERTGETGNNRDIKTAVRERRERRGTSERKAPAAPTQTTTTRTTNNTTGKRKGGGGGTGAKSTFGGVSTKSILKKGFAESSTKSKQKVKGGSGSGSMQRSSGSHGTKKTKKKG